MKTAVFINQQHELSDEQFGMLDGKFGGDWDLVKVPAQGWSLTEQRQVAMKYFRPAWDGGLNYEQACFVSPVPYLLKHLSWEAGANSSAQEINHCVSSTICKACWTFHNDRREKKVLPDGRVIHTVSQTGWEIV